MENNNKQKYYRVKEAAKVAGVSGAVITQAIRAGKLVATQISDSSRYGYHYLIAENDLLNWVEDRKTVKANAIATCKVPSEMTTEDIAAEIALRIKKAYNAGFKEGRKEGKREIMEAIRGVK